MTKKNTNNQPQIGLSDDVLKGVVEIFNTLLADEHVLYMKLRKYHWNVTGPHFNTLHVAFETQYTALEPIIDEIAERIRQYGVLAPGTLGEMAELARLEEQAGHNPDAATMVAELVADHETLVRHLREDIEKADEYDDVSAEDYLTGLLQQHQKFAWLLRATLENA